MIRTTGIFTSSNIFSKHPVFYFCPCIRVTNYTKPVACSICLPFASINQSTRLCHIEKLTILFVLFSNWKMHMRQKRELAMKAILPRMHRLQNFMLAIVRVRVVGNHCIGEAFQKKLIKVVAAALNLT